MEVFMAVRRTPKRAKRSTGQIQRMGGKEERVSQVGKARARVEAEEAHGAARFALAPGPKTDELRRAPKGGRVPGPGRPGSRKPRAGPEGLEPEDKVTRSRRKSPT